MNDVILKIPPEDPRYVYLSNTPRALLQHMNKIPQYQLLPNFRGVPRPEVFLHQCGNGRSLCSTGLWREVFLWCQRQGIPCQRPDDSQIYTNFSLSIDEFKELVLSWDLNITPREYQIRAAWLILKYKRSMSQLATRSGKTLIGYMVFRAAMEVLGVKRILMVVPSIQLVKQGLEDFREYQEFFNGEEIWASGESVSGSNLTIGTFQSLVLRSDRKSKRYDPNFFRGFDLVLVDECHKLTAKSIQDILTSLDAKNIKLQFGFTGTLPKENSIEWLCCQAMMGPKIQDINTMDLVGEGFLVEPNIHQIRIHYGTCKALDDVFERCSEYLVGNYVLDSSGKKVLLPKEERELTMIHKKMLPPLVQQIKEKVHLRTEYHKYLKKLLADGSQVLNVEQMLAQHSEEKLSLIERILSENEGNFIVFAHNTEYISLIYKYLKEKFPHKNVFKITGSDNLKKRQSILDEMLKNDDNILIGSYGCVSTGITFKRISGMVMAQSFKSEIINIQSIGRLLLPEEDKREALVFDLIDVFETRRIYSQGLQKIRDYASANYKHRVENISLSYKDLFGGTILRDTL